MGRRTLVLLAVLANVAFNYAYSKLPFGLADMKTASDRYPNLFTPAPYAFSIWGAIYLSWIVWAVAGLLPSRRTVALHDRTAALLILLNILGTVWILEFVLGNLPAAQIIIAVMLVTAIVGFRRALEGARSYWSILPFSLFFGWITVANLANLAAWMTQMNVWTDVPWAQAFLAVAVLAGAVVGFLYREPVHPLVAAWASLAIGVKSLGVDARVATAAFAAAGVSAVVAAINAGRRLKAAS
jgi:hypothetical protein